MKMQKIVALVAIVGLGAGSLWAMDAAALAKAVDGNAKLSAKVKAFVKAKLIPESTNKVFVAEVKKQNAKKMSMAAIKKTDQEWKDAEDELPIQTTLTSNATAKEVKKLVAANPAIIEAFVTDNQGANVGQNQLTGDYWQGDEAKWKNSFNGGKGGIDVGAIEFDKSANAQLQQVSLPIIDEDGAVIGAVTYGINVDKL
ncbi:MAG: PDC sensor domain-containing protein, partial [Planctomycetota bacterium]